MISLKIVSIGWSPITSWRYHLWHNALMLIRLFELGVELKGGGIGFGGLWQ